MKFTLNNETLVFCCCSVTQSCPTLCDPRDFSTPGFPVLHYFPEFAQTHVRRVDDAIHLFQSQQTSSGYNFSFFWVVLSLCCGTELQHATGLLLLRITGSRAPRLSSFSGLSSPASMWDLSSPTRDPMHIP